MGAGRGYGYKAWRWERRDLNLPSILLSSTFFSVFYPFKKKERKKVMMKFFSFLFTAVMVGVASAVCSEGMYFLLPLRWAVASMSG